MPTVDRVLPWRRTTAPPAIEVEPLVSAYRSRHPKASAELIARAYERARDAHAGQIRKSGEPYIQHPLAVARIVAELGLDDVTIAAALLHDAVEDTGVTPRRHRAPSSAPRSPRIVDGVTKLERVQFDSKEAQQAATMRKMLVAMAKDLRVLIIKLADRLHNMRTLGRHAGVEAGAHRPGDARHLRAAGPPPRHAGHEAAARGPRLRHAAPEAVRRDRPHGGARARPSATSTSTQVLEQVRERLAELRIDAEVTGRPKHLWSIYEKMVVKGKRVRRHLRPGRHPGPRRLGEGLLRRARARSTPRGSRCRAGSRTTSRCPSSTSTSRCTRRWSGRRASRSRCRSAPARCTSGPSTASPPTGPTRTATPRRRPGLAQPHRRLAAGDLRPRPSSWPTSRSTSTRTRSSSSRPRAGSITLADGRHADRLRLRHPHRGRPRAASAPGSTAGWCRSTTELASGDTVRDLHLQGRGRRARRATG